MKRICPVCQSALNQNCYVKDSGSEALSYLNMIVKDDNLKKEKYELQSCYCPKCGHVEFYIDLTPSTKQKNTVDNTIDATVQQFADEHNNREKRNHY